MFRLVFPGAPVARSSPVRRSWISAVVLAAASSCGGLGEPVDPYHCRDSYCVGGDVTVSYTAIFNPHLLDMVVVLDDSVPSGPGAVTYSLTCAASYEQPDQGPSHA